MAKTLHILVEKFVKCPMIEDEPLGTNYCLACVHCKGDVVKDGETFIICESEK